VEYFGGKSLLISTAAWEWVVGCG